MDTRFSRWLVEWQSASHTDYVDILGMVYLGDLFLENVWTLLKIELRVPFRALEIQL